MRARSGLTCTPIVTTLLLRNWPLDDYRSFNALAESVNGLYKAELIERHQPWRTVEQVELATATWVDWWNTRRLHEACGDVPPAEFETRHQIETVA